MKNIDLPTYRRLSQGARDAKPVVGYTHNFYRYPARFSPRFVATAIDCFSRKGDVILDPFMGGATTVVEAMAAGRRAIGTDVNQLAVFVAKVKTSALSKSERRAITDWADRVVPTLKCNLTFDGTGKSPRNMNLMHTRWLNKMISMLLTSIDAKLVTRAAQRFARCIVLNVGQWALNGRTRVPCAAEFRERIVRTTYDMVYSLSSFQEKLKASEHPIYKPLLRENDAEQIDRDSSIAALGPVDLVVTSPPYPGIHMLYHRWQVDGRKETDAPYWIAACSDGAGSSYYNFADRRRSAEDRYFEKAARTFGAIRRVMRSRALVIQMIAFAHPERQFKKYLRMMEAMGFTEVRMHGTRRIWRAVPGRRWHAKLKGDLPSSQEVVLVHRAT